MGYRVLESSAEQNTGSDEIFALGDSGEGAIVLLSAANSADATEAGVIEGSPDHSGTAVNSLVISNIANDGDIQMLVSDAGASKEFLYANGDTADLQVGHGMATVNIKTASGAVTMNPGTGVVVGHTSQETISIGDGATDLVPGVQVLGTGQVDASLMLAAFSATATAAGAPLLALVKSGDAAIDGTHVVVTDGEELGNIIAYGDDGTDLEAPAAMISFEVDGTPGTGDMPGRILFATTTNDGEVLTERMRINAAGNIGIVAAAKLFMDGVAGTGNTYLQEVSDGDVRIYCNAIRVADFVNTGVTFNENGTADTVDVNFRVESKGNANMLVIDGGLNNMGLGDVVDNRVFLSVGSSFTASGAGGNSTGDFIQIAGTFSSEEECTLRQTGMRITPNLTTENASYNVATMATVQIDEPSITLTGGTATVTQANTLLINGIPTEGSLNEAGEATGGTKNYGIQIDGGADANYALYLALTSSDVTNGFNLISAADEFMSLQKISGGDGGFIMRGYSSGAAAIAFEGHADAADIIDTSATGSSAVIAMHAYEDDGSNGRRAVVTGNIFSIENASVARFIMKEDGEIIATNVTSGQMDATAFDAYDDVGLVRTFSRQRVNDMGVAMSKWDKSITTNREELRELGVLSEEYDFYSVQRMNDLLGGAIWQTHQSMMEIAAVLTPEQRQQLPEQMQERLAIAAS